MWAGSKKCQEDAVGGIESIRFIVVKKTKVLYGGRSTWAASNCSMLHSISSIYQEQITNLILVQWSDPLPQKQKKWDKKVCHVLYMLSSLDMYIFKKVSIIRHVHLSLVVRFTKKKKKWKSCQIYFKWLPCFQTCSCREHACDIRHEWLHMGCRL